MKSTPPSVSCAQLSQRELRQDDLPAIHALHLRSTQGLDNEMVRQESLESLSQQLERSHFLGKFHQDELIAYGVLQHTLTEAERLPQHIASDAAQPQLILAGISVAPEWRGQGLQRRLIMLRTAMAPANALLFSTAAPANWYSWNNLLAWDFHVRALIPFCEGHVRYLMVRQALPAHCIFPDLSKEFHSLDIKRQQALLETGWRGAQPGHDPRYLRYVPVDKGVA